MVWYACVEWSVLILRWSLPSAAAPTSTCKSAQPPSELEESAPDGVPAESKAVKLKASQNPKLVS